MTDKELFIASEHALTNVFDQIKPDQWKMEVPAYLSDAKMTLREILNAHAYDDIWVPEILAGKTIQEVGSAYDGDLLGVDPEASWHRIVDLSIDAVTRLEDLNKTVHLSYGDFPAREYLWHISIFRTFRAVEIARFIGVDDTLPHELVEGMWEMLMPHVEEWRTMGIFGPAIQVPDDAPLQERLLGLAGKPPRVGME